MSEFTKTMRDWRRMCNAFVKQYDNDCCKYCPLDHLKSCGAIWEISQDAFCKIEEKVKKWAAEHPEPVYPTVYEWLVSIGLLGKDMWAMSDVYKPIPADIAEKLGLKPKGGSGDEAD